MAFRTSRLLTGSLQNLNTLCNTVSHSSNSINRRLSYLANRGANICLDTHPHTGIKNKDAIVATQWCIQIRHKGRDKPKKNTDKHKPNHTVELDKTTISEIVDVDKYEQQLANILENLRHEYVHKLSLRTNVGTFDKIEVKLDNETIPLNQVASIVQKGPSLIVLNLSQNIKFVPAVMSALQSSGMNLNPQQEGPSTIYVNIPKVSRDHREELAKGAKTIFNNTKEKLDKLFAETMKKVNKTKSTEIKKTIESKLLQDKRKIQADAEALMKAKQKELLDS